MGTFHAELVGSGNHAITSNPNTSGTSYANLAARDADTTFSTDSDNVNKVVRVESPLSFYILTSVVPAWLEFTSTTTDEWTELDDTPSAISAGLVVQGNSGGTALEFGQALATTDSPTFAALTVSGRINNATLFDDATLFNLLVGEEAGAAITTAIAVTAVGHDALASTLTGSNNTAVGFKAQFSTLGGQANTAVGASALQLNTTGSNNEAFGFLALQDNTSGDDNTAVGTSALLLNITGSDNVGIGGTALRANISGRRNVAIGSGAGLNLAGVTLTGENTLLGYNTGLGITTGVQNTILGANVIGLSATLSNNIILADGAGVTRLQFDSSGNGVIGGSLQVTGALLDSSGDAGTSGQVLSSTVTGTNWISGVGNVLTSDTLDSLTMIVGAGSESIQAVDAAATTANISVDSGFQMIQINAAVDGHIAYRLLDNTGTLRSEFLYEDDLDTAGFFSAVPFVFSINSTLSLNALTAMDFVSSTGVFSFKTTTNSLTAWQVQNSSSVAVISVDTINLNFGVGVAVPLIKLHVQEATEDEQFRLGYDAANYSSFTTSSGGDLTIDPTGGDTSILGTLRLTGAFLDSSSDPGTSGQILSSTVTGTNWIDEVGNVARVGTPVDNQVAVWTNATTIEGDAGLAWDGIDLAVSGTVNGATILAAISSNNLIYGVNGGVALTSGSGNTALGINSLTATTIGSSNTAVGRATLTANIGGTGNTAIGVSSLTTNTSGGNNAGVGFQSLLLNVAGTRNTGIGAQASLSNASGDDNTACGYQALGNNASGDRNTALGAFSGPTLVTADGFGDNTCVGYDTGRGITTGVQNTILGANVTGLAAALSNNVILADGGGNIRLQFDSSGDGVIGGGLQVTGAFLDTSGDAGTSGQMLSSTVTGTNWIDPVGDVIASGTPLNNQVAVWTDANTIEGTTSLTFSGNTLRVGRSASEFADLIINPGGDLILNISGNVTTLKNSVDATTGFRLATAASVTYLVGDSVNERIGIGMGLFAPDTSLHTLSAGADTTAVITTETTGTNAGEFKTFVGSRDPNANVTGAGGDLYVRDGAALSNLFFSKEAATGTEWKSASLNNPEVHEIFSTAEYEDLGSGGVITTSELTTTLDFKTDIFTSTSLVISAATHELQFLDQSETKSIIYIGSATYIASAVGGDLTCRNSTFVSGVAVSQFLDYLGDGRIPAIDVLTFSESSTIFGYNLGTVGRLSTAERGPIFNINEGSALINLTSGLEVDAVSIFGLQSVYIDQETEIGMGEPVVTITDSSYKPGRATFVTLVGSLFSGESLVRVDAGLPETYRVNVFNTNLVLNGTATIFDTSGATNTFSAVADNSISATAITSVVDSSGVASFTHAGTSPLVGAEVTVSGFTTNPTYNTTGIVTARTATTFEIDYVAFVATEAGSFLVDGVTVTATAHGLTAGTGVTLDTTLSTAYDGGFLIYNVSTNAFDIQSAFSATQAGAWSTEGLDHTDLRVLTSNNPGTQDSQTIAFGFTNSNTTATTITDGTYAAIDVSIFAENSVTQRFKLTDTTAAIFTLTALEAFSGFLRGGLTAVKTGSTANYRFAMSTNSVVPTFATANFVPIEVKTTKVSVPLLFVVDLSKGETIQVMVAGDGTSDVLTITDLVIGIG